MQRNDVNPFLTITHPECPSWCLDHVDDVDTVPDPPSPSRVHRGPVRRAVVHDDPYAVLHLELIRPDYDGQVGDTGVAVVLIERDGTVVGDLLPGPVPVESCRELIEGLAELLHIAEPAPPVVPAQRSGLTAGLRSFLVAEAVAE